MAKIYDYVITNVSLIQHVTIFCDRLTLMFDGTRETKIQDLQLVREKVAKGIPSNF